MPDHNHHRERSIPQIRLEQPLPPLPLLPLPISPNTPTIRIQVPDQLSYEPYHDEESDEEGASASEEIGGRQDGRGRRKQPYADNHLSPITPSQASSPTGGSHTPYRDHLSPKSPTSRTAFSFSISRPQSPSNASATTSQISPRTVNPTSAQEHQEEQCKPPEYEPMYDYLRSRPRPIHAFTSPNSNTFLSPTSGPQSPTDFMPYRDDVDHPFIITLSPLSPQHLPHAQNQDGEGEEGLPSYEELYLQHQCPHRQDELQQLVRQMDAEGNMAEEICKFVVGMIMLGLCVVGVGLAFNWGRGWDPPCGEGRC